MVGSLAGEFSEAGSSNTFFRRRAGLRTTTGNYNTFLGTGAGKANISGSNNICIGNNAQPSTPTTSNQIRLSDAAISHAAIQIGWNITSDRRWKDNVRALLYGLKLLSQLRLVDYIRKNNTKQTREMGFIAQEIEQVLEAVGYADQGFLTKDVNGYFTLRYNDLIALLTRAVQEQQALISNQEIKIESQDVKIQKLETMLQNRTNALTEELALIKSLLQESKNNQNKNSPLTTSKR